MATCNWCGRKYISETGYDNQYCSERCKRAYDGDDSWVNEYDKSKAKIDKYLDKIMGE